MRRGIVAGALVCALVSLSTEAMAWGHRHHHRHHHHRIVHHRVPLRTVAASNIVTVASAAGPITVAAYLAPKFQALIRDFVAAGYRPRHVGCFARGGHVPRSRHYAGAACDFDQRGWGRTVAFMYRAHAIIARHGLRDGCSFRDCGHVDDGVPLHSYRLARRYAHSRFGG